MKTCLLIFIITAVLFGLSQPELAYACSCIPPRSVSEELRDAGAVFSGMVTAVSQTQRSSASGSLEGSLGKKVTFAVDKACKGVTESAVTIETGIGGGDCGFNFEEGKSYIVYTESQNPRSANICSRTAELAQAQDDLQELGAPINTFTNSQPTTPTFGNVRGVSPRTLAGLGTAVALSLIMYWLAKRWDEKHPLS